MKRHDEIDNLTAKFGRMATELKLQQDTLLSYGRGLESMLAERTAELEHERVNLEISVAKRTATLIAENEKLRIHAAVCTQRSHEITLLSKMNDFLQSSATEGEAYAVISDVVTQLFPDDSGAVFVLNASRDMLETATVWGPLPPDVSDFPLNDCWAQRRGQDYLVLNNELRCPHVNCDGHMYVCLPLIAHGETLGILHILDGLAKNNKADEDRMVEKSRLARILADNIGLGIANLKLREAMRDLSIRDPLTGLFNRRYMEEALLQEQHRARRDKTQLAVIMIDIDHFKAFNDTFGHDGGDAVLRALGTFFTKRVRGSDIACRFGGEEFLLILSPSTSEGARQRAEKIRADWAMLRVCHGKRELGAITLSLGVAMFPDAADGVAAMLKAADVALYEAKESGRNRVVVFDESMGGKSG